MALAQAAGLRMHRGAIEVDEHLRSSAPNIYAIGDAASAWNPRYRRGAMHSEHWDNAKRQGLAVAANICGRDVVYDRVPYLYSDQYDVGMEYRGYAPEWDEVVVRGDLETTRVPRFLAPARPSRGGDERQPVGRRRRAPGDWSSRARPVDPRRLADVSATAH